MQTEAECFSKSNLDRDIAALEAIEKTDLPTQIVRGKEKPVNMVIYKRRMQKQIVREHQEKLAALAVAPIVAAGYPDAVGKVQFGKIVIRINGLSLAEGI